MRFCVRFSLLASRSALLALGLSGPALAAGTPTSSFQVQMTIQDECSVQSVGDLAFGSATVLTASRDAVTTLSMRCTASTPYNVGIGPGTGAGASVATRKMGRAASTDTITYTLYSDAAHTRIWGDTLSVNTMSGTGTGAAQTMTIYGLFFFNYTATTVFYTDTVAVTSTD